MLGVLRGAWSWWNSPRREGRALHRDARWVIEDAESGHRSERTLEVARLTRDELAACHAGLEQMPGERDAIIREAQRRHREARRRNDSVALTAFTLVIIYMKAEALGAEGDAARAAVDGLLDRWRHAFDD